jgi:hypothetical protein
MAKSIVALFLVALVVSAAVQSVSADKAVRKLLATQQNGCSSRPPSEGFLFTFIITASFWGHRSWLGNYQCCDGQWYNGGCHQGSCTWGNNTYNNNVWADGWQCCGGSWVRSGCNQGSNSCWYNGNQFSNYAWWEGMQCCDGSFKQGGCGYRN